MGNKGLSIAIGLIFLAVFNVIFFVVGGVDHATAEWISYLFITLACICTMLIPLLSPATRSDTVLTGSIAAISGAYFAIEFVAGLLFILMLKGAWQGALVVQLILFAAYVAVVATNLRMNDRTARAEQIEATERADFNSLIRFAQEMLTHTDDPEIERVVRHAADDLRCSPTRSNGSVAALEADIRMQLGALSAAVQSNDATAAATAGERIEKLIAARNQALKTIG